MTKEENSLVAEAQGAYQRAFKHVFNSPHARESARGRYLYRLGLIGLLEAELQVSHEDLE